jgi:hypothetical protein
VSAAAHDRPVSFPRAFALGGPMAARSQAAALLLLRAQLRGDTIPLPARTRPLVRGSRAKWVRPRDHMPLSVPRIAPPRWRVREESVLAALRTRYGSKAPFQSLGHAPGRRHTRAKRTAPPRGSAAAPDVLADLARRLARSPSHAAAAELTRACLHHPEDLPRIAAAAAYFELSATPVSAVQILIDGLGSKDPLARAVAATAVAQIAPEEPRLRAFLESRPGPSRRPPSRTSLLVHGTFARNSAWWQPGGDFHEYLRADVRPDLYGASDRFEWSGGWSDGARAVGAADLEAWVTAHGLEGLALFTHSHGGSVGMLASQGGLEIGELVLLSCPVHARYAPDWIRVKRVVSVRVHLDLVILVDGGGQQFTDARIEEHVLPIWFDHFATHDPKVWRDHDVPSLI